MTAGRSKAAVENINIVVVVAAAAQYTCGNVLKCIIKNVLKTGEIKEIARK